MGQQRRQGKNNDGTVGINYVDGVVENNSGTVGDNQGTVENNFGGTVNNSGDGKVNNQYSFNVEITTENATASTTPSGDLALFNNCTG